MNDVSFKEAAAFFILFKMVVFIKKGDPCS